MPSPFPGMDPYIESSGRWADFHSSMIPAIRGQLNARLPEGFVAAAQQYVWIQEPEANGGRREKAPDVYVSKRSGEGQSSGGTAVVTAPETIFLPAIEPRRQRYVEIIDRETRAVVTAIELLSPVNKKAGDGRRAYLGKRNEFLAAGVSLVEIDLLRGGRRLPLSDPSPEIRDYYVMVCRSWEQPRADFWTCSLRDPLPAVPVPLVEGLPEVILDLRACAERVYDEGRYGTDIRYDRPLTPRLSKGDSAWVNELLSARKTGNTSSLEKDS